jgi:hypothetical protein
MWGCSSVGRAVRSQRTGQGFESPHLHQPSLERSEDEGCRDIAPKERSRASQPPSNRPLKLRLLHTLLTHIENGVESIKKSPHYLVSKAHSYCVRVNVPKDLQRFIGRQELRYSLKTVCLGFERHRAQLISDQIQRFQAAGHRHVFFMTRSRKFSRSLFWQCKSGGYMFFQKGRRVSLHEIGFHSHALPVRQTFKPATSDP